MAERMKGRKRRARTRELRRWLRERVGLCECGRVELHLGARPGGQPPDGPVEHCNHGNCVQICCPVCGRVRTSVGPMGCLCGSRPGGHGRRDEQPRPGVRKKYRDRRPRPLHWWQKHPRMFEGVEGPTCE